MRRKPTRRKGKTKAEWRANYKSLAQGYEFLGDEMERQRIDFHEERAKQVEHVRMIAEVTRDVIGYLRKVDRPNIEVSEAESSARHVLNLTGRFVAKWGS